MLFLQKSTEDWWWASSHGATTITWSSISAKPVSLWRQIWMLLQILTRGGFTHSFNPTAQKISTISADTPKISVINSVSDISPSVPELWCRLRARKVFLLHVMMTQWSWPLTSWIYIVITLSYQTFQPHFVIVIIRNLELWHLISSFLRVRVHTVFLSGQKISGARERWDEAAQVSLNNILTTGAVRSTLVLRGLLSVCFYLTQRGGCGCMT